MNRVFWRDGLIGGVIDLFRDESQVYSLTESHLYICTPEGWDKCTDVTLMQFVIDQLTQWYKSESAFNGRGIVIMAVDRLKCIRLRSCNPCCEISTGLHGECVLPHGEIPTITVVNWRDRMIGGIIDIHTYGGDSTYACITYENVYIYPYLPTEFGSHRKSCTNHTLLASLRTELKKWMKTNKVCCSDKDNAAVIAVARLKKILNGMRNISKLIEVSEYPPFTPTTTFKVFQNDPKNYQHGHEYLNEYHRYDVYTEMEAKDCFTINCVRVFGILSQNTAFYVTKDRIQYEHSSGGNVATRSEMRLLLAAINRDLKIITSNWHRPTRNSDSVLSWDESTLQTVKKWVTDRLHDFTGHSIEFKQLELENTVTYLRYLYNGLKDEDET